MARTEEIRYHDEFGVFVCWITAAEAAIKQSMGLIEPHYERRGHEVREIGCRKCRPVKQNPNSSACAIDAREVFLHAMISARIPIGKELSVGDCQRVEGKIEAWPTCGDDKAVRVGPAA